MGDYIDRKKLKEMFWDACRNCLSEDDIADLIDDVPPEDVAPVIHAKRIKTKKHRWKTYSNGEIDFCAWDRGYCNGPQCIDCGEHFCIHCVEKDGGEEAVKQRPEKEDCEQKTVCSVCGRYVPDDAPYCHCGAKMDLE